MARVYIYVVARDFGFAPNPFHGSCTLATCKPRIRGKAEIGDWVVGMGGSKLEAVGKCIYAMKVTDAMSFDEYWNDPRYYDKRPVRNGSRKMMVGDNIYHRDGGEWRQEDSHHSQPDGSSDSYNIETDTSADRMLISEHFYYFGKAAPEVPAELLKAIGYRNLRNHRVFTMQQCYRLINWTEDSFPQYLNVVGGQPFQFRRSGARFSGRKNAIIA